MKKMKKKIDAIKLKAEIDKYIEEMQRRRRKIGGIVAIATVAGVNALEMAKEIIDDMITDEEDTDGEARSDRD